MINSVPLTIFQRLQFETLWFLCRLFASSPDWIRYGVVGNIIFFVLYYCVRYRMGVVMENLTNSFPEKSRAELLVIRRKFFMTLAEIFVDTVSLAGANEEKANKMIRFADLERHSTEVLGRDWIALMAHYGCWEYGSFWGTFVPSQVLVAVYHPLRSVVIDELYHRIRCRHNTETVAMNDCLRFYLRNRNGGLDGKNLVLGLIADQNPPRRPNSHWFNFLNQETIFFDGGEKLAMKCHLPVYFAYMDRVHRGFYEVRFEQIYDGKEAVEENEITERYVRRLEDMIRQRPELWMWSHRRWKHKR